MSQSRCMHGLCTVQFKGVALAETLIQNQPLDVHNVVDLSCFGLPRCYKYILIKTKDITQFVEIVFVLSSHPNDFSSTQ